MISLPYCQIQEEITQPSSSVRKHNKELGIIQIQHCMPYKMKRSHLCRTCHHSSSTHQNSQVLWNPNLLVQIPIIPHRGMRQVTTLVTANIRFVRIFQYFWIYQNPSVAIVDVIAWASPKYVFCKNENWNLSFWHIETRVPVVFRPSASKKKEKR